MTLVSATSYLYNKGQTYNGLFHQADWYPTILSMIDSDQSTRDLDGVDQWNALIHNGASPRKTVSYKRVKCSFCWLLFKALLMV